MKSFVRYHAQILAALTICSYALAQIPAGIATVKGIGYKQVSAAELVVFDPVYEVQVGFSTPVPDATTVQLRGPVTVDIPRRTSTFFALLRTVTSEAQLESAFPDGVYTVVVSGGGLSSQTPITVTSQPALPPVRISNFDELQELFSSQFEVRWSPLENGTSADELILRIAQGGSPVFTSSPSSSAPSIDGRSTSLRVSSLTISPGDRLDCNLTGYRASFSRTNGGATEIASVRGFKINFPVARVVAVPPTITVQPQSVAVGQGTTLALFVGATGIARSYSWVRNGLLLGAPNSPSLILENVNQSHAGDYSARVSSGGSVIESRRVSVRVLANTLPSIISNLSIRARLEQGGARLSIGFATRSEGSATSMSVLSRAAGPALGALGLTGFLADPKIELYSGSVKISENDNWGGDPLVSANSARLGAFGFGPVTSRDAALFLPALSSGSFTAQISSVDGKAGIVVGEIYDATPFIAISEIGPHLVNVSALSAVGTGTGTLIAGFIIRGALARTVLIRAIGPTLSEFGVESPLQDPQLTVHSVSSIVAENDNWAGTQPLSAAFRQVGAFQLDPSSKDSALLVTLPPGSYTAQVNGAGGTTGVALVEVYEVP